MRSEPYNTSYEPEIDGLRAIAILLVFLFHLDLELFSGGFLGVDVFFVISGFLITRKIRNELSQNRFCLSTFYKNRIKRIFPALFVVLALTFLLGTFVLSPEALVDLGKSTIFSVFPFSNVLYWSEAGYFDKPTQAKVLLHTWSLGVEEQFYLVWPAFLLLAWRKLKSQREFLGIIASISCLSLGSAIFVSSRSLSTAFYWMPFRAYQFGLGAIGLIIADKLDPKKNWFLEFLMVVGLIGVLFPSVAVEKKTLQFNIWPEILAGVGSLCIILARRAKFSALLLKNQILRTIGKLSYSIYLVHWPVIVFLKYVERDFNSNLTRLMAFSLTIVFAVPLHRFIEEPFWKGDGVKRIRKNSCLSIGCIGVLAAVIIACIQVINSNGWDFRYSEPIRLLLKANPTTFPGVMLRAGTCLSEDPKAIKPICYESKPNEKNILLLGSSRLAAMYEGLKTELSSDWKVYQYTLPGCRCFWGCDWSQMESWCRPAFEKLMAEILPHYKFQVVVLEKNRFYGQAHDVESKAEEAFLKLGSKVVWILENPRLPFSMIDRLAYSKTEEKFQSYWDLAWKNRVVNNLPQTPNTFDLRKVFCDEEQFCKWKEKDKLFYSDQVHFSEVASRFVAVSFEKWLIQNKMLD